MAAAMTRSRSTRGLYLTLSVMSLFCFTHSVGVKEQLEEMKDQLKKVEQVIEFWKAKLESERKSTFEVMNGNVARMKCIRAHSLAPVQTIEFLEDYTENTNSHVRKSFTNMAATMQELESRLEDMKAQVKYAEHFSTDSGQLMF